MKISLNWLKDYVDLKGLSTKIIVDKLTMSGLEVEDVFDQKEVYKGFVVGHVEEKEKHPNADRLSVCKVNDGKESLQVICGAPNVEKGQKVVFAPVGTIIPKGNFELTKAKIRSVESFGMICAEDELELSDDHSGIMVLDSKLKAGTPVTKALKLNDVIMEIAITPNRPDALSHIGVARDLAAIFNRKLSIPKVKLKESNTNIKTAASIEIIDSENCPRYSGKVVKNVTIKESPEWLKNRISNIGLRPRNNVVDITNFVMYECGQPLHAFDLKMLNGQKIVVQSTIKESVFTTLDSKERKLSVGSLMICDGEREVAIAGVMGGENSEITDETKNILIESAHFNPSSIRKTSKLLGLSTDASYRFERGVDPGNTVYAAERTAQLISELAGGEILNGILDVYPNKIKEKKIKLRFSRIDKILGYNISKTSVKSILRKLGIKINSELKDAVNVTIPTFRPDIEREIDVIEEVARIAGYDNVPTVSRVNVTLEVKHDETSFIDELQEYSSALGLSEMINNPLQPEAFGRLTGNPIKISNPQNLDMEYLRTSMLPGALNIIAKNIKKGEKDLALFEIGNIFNLNSRKNEISSFEDFVEEEKLIFVLSGEKTDREWYGTASSYDFYDLKGVVNSFLGKLSLDYVANDSYYSQGNSIYEYYFTKNYKNVVIGYGGKLKPDVLIQFDIDQDVFCFEFDIAVLKSIKTENKKFVEPLKYPKVFRDLAFVFDNKTRYEDVKNFILENKSELLKNVTIFDIFESDDLGLNKKSMAFQLEYFNENRTLTEEEVEKEFMDLIKIVSNKFNAQLRGK